MGACRRTGDRAHADPETVNGRPTTLHGSERTRILGQEQQAAWKKFGNPVFGPASNLAVVHEIILGGVVTYLSMFTLILPYTIMDNSQTSDNPTFDWRNVDSCGLILGNNTPESTLSKSKRTLKELNVSIPLDLLHIFSIDGFQIKSKALEFKMKYTSVLYPDWRPDMMPNKICLNAKLDTETWQFVSLEDYFNKKEIQEISNWTQDNIQKLLKIGTEFELYERQIYHFLYEILALFYALKSIPSAMKEKLKNIKIATDLYHNRILAEIISGYAKKGAWVDLHPQRGTRIPDIEIGNILIDVKTILLTGKDRKELMRKFTERLRTDIERENQKQQIGKDGSFVIGVWSGIINSIIHTAYYNRIISGYDNSVRFYETLPPINTKKAILVIPGLNAFQDNYLVFDRERICDTIDYLADSGYQKILEGESMKYLVLNNIRHGCEFGVTSDNPALFFKFR